MDNLESAILHAVREKLCQLGPETRQLCESDAFLHDVAMPIRGDLCAYCEKDPASADKHLMVLETYASFAAVLHYRLAHAIRQLSPQPLQRSEYLASMLANTGKTISGIEIHPAAHIGARFVIDHGVGTVIGETAVVGSECYFLGGITIGAVGIAGNPWGKRHPTIGSFVQVGKNASILGNVTVGDNCFIGPNCIIRHDLPPGMRVTTLTQLQLSRSDGAASGCDGLINFGDRVLISYRNGMRPNFFLVDETGARTPLQAAPCAFLEDCYFLSLGEVARARLRGGRLVTIEDDGRVLLQFRV
jgi:serine O-acetyltransferase